MTQDEAMRLIDRLVLDLARATGQPEQVVRLGYGIDRPSVAEPTGRPGRDRSRAVIQLDLWTRTRTRLVASRAVGRAGVTGLGGASRTRDRQGAPGRAA